MSKGSLGKRLRSENMNRSEDAILNISSGIASGLAYLHQEGVLHCDLKSDNILLSYDYMPLLADFGLSRRIEGSLAFSYSSAKPATLRWSAIELFNNDAQFTETSDVWAFGMVLYEVMCCKVPYFEQLHEPQVLKQIMGGDVPVWPDECSEKQTKHDALRALRRLASACWYKHLKERPSMLTICEIIKSLWDSNSDAEWNDDRLSLIETPAEDECKPMLFVTDEILEDFRKSFSALNHFQQAPVSAYSFPLLFANRFRMPTNMGRDGGNIGQTQEQLECVKQYSITMSEDQLNDIISDSDNESMSSMTTTKIQSYFQTRHGRRFHSHSTVPYPLPADEDEIQIRSNRSI